MPVNNICLFMQSSRGNLCLILVYGDSNMDQTGKILIPCLNYIKWKVTNMLSVAMLVYNVEGIVKFVQVV